MHSWTGEIALGEKDDFFFVFSFFYNIYSLNIFETDSKNVDIDIKYLIYFNKNSHELYTCWGLFLKLQSVTERINANFKILSLTAAGLHSSF